MARKTLSDRSIARLKPTEKRMAIPDPACAGLYVRVQPSGARSFCAVGRNKAGKQVWTTLGGCGEMTVEAARERARTVRERIKRGLPALEAEPDAPVTFGAAADDWLKRHVDAKGLRSAPEIRRILDKHVRPAWGDLPISSIRRKAVAELLDAVEDGHGKRQADYVFAIVRPIFNLAVARDETLANPIVRGLRKVEPTKRKRILDDDELRAVWKATETGAFGGIVRLALLTAQRREKIATMRWSDIKGDVWTVPAEEREKGVGGEMRLPAAALAVLAAQPQVAGNPYVFAGRGDGYFNAWSSAKARLDAACGVSGWTVHDLRRTARSLMSRAGVQPHIAERVLGHIQPGVAGVYDRHSYVAEKSVALGDLAALLNGIVSEAARPRLAEAAA